GRGLSNEDGATGHSDRYHPVKQIRRARTAGVILRNDTFQVHCQKPRNPTLTLGFCLRLPEPKIESLLWFPRLVTAIMKRESGCYIPLRVTVPFSQPPWLLSNTLRTTRHCSFCPLGVKVDNNEVSQRPRHPAAQAPFLAYSKHRCHGTTCIPTRDLRTHHRQCRRSRGTPFVCTCLQVMVPSQEPEHLPRRFIVRGHIQGHLRGFAGCYTFTIAMETDTSRLPVFFNPRCLYCMGVCCYTRPVCVFIHPTEETQSVFFGRWIPLPRSASQLLTPFISASAQYSSHLSSRRICLVPVLLPPPNCPIHVGKLKTFK
ncbi:hypothetical protein EDD18DRAFT_1400045, partial [Armillaria luteobubalina]